MSNHIGSDFDDFLREEGTLAEVEDAAWKRVLSFSYECEECDGTVRPKLIEREAFRHKSGSVILENVVIGICDSCGNRYYSADILHRVHEIATSQRIVVDPQILGGKPVIRGTRLAVGIILDLLSQGWSNDEILRNYPGIELADIQSCRYMPTVK
jgi:YgiT-type zinc finger domain-containing protein